MRKTHLKHIPPAKVQDILDTCAATTDWRQVATDNHMEYDIIRRMVKRELEYVKRDFYFVDFDRQTRYNRIRANRPKVNGLMTIEQRAATLEYYARTAGATLATTAKH